MKYVCIEVEKESGCWAVAHYIHMETGGEATGEAATASDAPETGPGAAPELRSSTMDRWGFDRLAAQRSGRNTPSPAARLK